MTNEQDDSPNDAVASHVTDGAGAGGAEKEGHAVRSAFVYATDIDLNDRNDSHTLVVLMVGENKTVLELGCAEGSTTRILRARGCRVTGIEIDPTAAKAAEEFAERMIVDNLDTMDFNAALGRERFDVIVAADVLEHLSDPMRCLRACAGFLSADGEVVLSIPNIAHADVRLTLLDGHFDYSEWGLLDHTHLRFFTRDSLLDFLESCGFAELELKRVTRPIGGTELAPAVERFPTLVERIAEDPEAETYQFVLRAIPYLKDPHIAELVQQRAILARQVRELHKLEAYRGAHRRLMHLVCPDLVDSDSVGPSEGPTRAKVQEVERTVLGVLEERRELLRARDELDDLRRSETFRVGRLVLSPLMFARRWTVRALRAWRRSGLTTE